MMDPIIKQPDLTKSEVDSIILSWLTAYCSSDISKRKTNIMAFLLTFTTKNNKLKAHIPHLKDFEQCGVSRTKIKIELEELEALNIIKWDRSEMTFYINPETEKWKANRYKKFNAARFEQLIDLNS